MSSEELARKLQRRLRLEELAETNQGAPEPAPCAAQAGDQEPEPPTRELSASADSELSAQLNRRLDINRGAARSRRSKVFNPYTEFPEFSRRLLRDLESMFKKYDAGRDGFIDLMELKLMMEKLGAPQTHLGLKNMIKEVDDDIDGKLSFREFLLIFHKAAAGELQEDSGLLALAKLSEINVALEGVRGAKNFFEAKVLLATCRENVNEPAYRAVNTLILERLPSKAHAHWAQVLSCSSRFEAELKAEQDERKREEETRRIRQAAFRELKAAFSA